MLFKLQKINFSSVFLSKKLWRKLNEAANFCLNYTLKFTESVSEKKSCDNLRCCQIIIIIVLNVFVNIQISLLFLVAGSQSRNISFTRNELVEFLRSCSSAKFQEKCNYLYEKIRRATESTELSAEIKQKLATFTKQYKSKWHASSRNYQAFQNNN